MEDILERLRDYRIVFNGENELAFVRIKQTIADDMFRDMENNGNLLRSDFNSLNIRIRNAEALLDEAKAAERGTYEEYERQKEKERTAEENYQREMRIARDNFYSADFPDTAFLAEVYLSRVQNAINNAKNYKTVAKNGASEDLYNEWKELKNQNKSAEAEIEELKNLLPSMEKKLEWYKWCDYEKNHYYGALFHHEFHTQRLESFQNIINNYKELISNNSRIEGMEEVKEELLHEVDFITKLSIKQYVRLAKEQEECYKQGKKSGCKEAWYRLAGRFSVLKENDRSNPQLETPVMIEVVKNLLNDAQYNIQQSSSEESENDTEWIRFSCDDSINLCDFYNDLARGKNEIVSEVDGYFKYAKDNMENYIKKMEDIIYKVCDVIKNEDVQYEKVERLYYTIETYEKENYRIDEFIYNEEKHPIYKYYDILQHLMDSIEIKYYSPLNDDIENAVIDPLCFGLDRYQEERKLDYKKEKRYNVLVEKEIVGLEYNLLPFRRCKQHLILEGYRNECLSVYQLLLNIMKNLNPCNNYDEANEKIKNEIKESNDRLENLKYQLKEIINKVESNEKQLLQYQDEIDELTLKYCEYEDSCYSQIIENYGNILNVIDNHIDYEMKRVELIKRMIESINLLKKLINNPNASKPYSLMKDEIIETPLYLLERPSNRRSTIIMSNRSSRIVPIMSIRILVRPRSRNINNNSSDFAIYENDNSPDEEKLNEENDVEPTYILLKNLLIWKYDILSLYYFSPFEILYADIENEYGFYCKNKMEYRMYSVRYQIDYDGLKYGKHGNWNWALYKNISKHLDDMKSRYKRLLTDNSLEKGFINKFHYILYQFCESRRRDCSEIRKTINVYHEKLLKLLEGLIASENRVEMRIIKKLDKDIKKNLLGDTFLAYFHSFIPGICFGYDYAGKKWLDEKEKNFNSM